jgi:hypothetical protein
MVSACASRPQPRATAGGPTVPADQLQMRDPDRIAKSRGPVVAPLRPVPVRLDEATAKQATEPK